MRFNKRVLFLTLMMTLAILLIMATMSVSATQPAPTPRPTLFPSPTPSLISTIPPTIRAVAPLATATLTYQQPQDVFIAIGDEVSGVIPNNTTPARYIFNGQGGQLITVTAVTGNNEAMNINLQDVNGGPVPVINTVNYSTSYLLPYTGQFIIFVNQRYGGGYNIPFRLSLTEAVSTPIEYGQTVEAAMPVEEAIAGFYTFLGEQGDRILIAATSPQFDPTITFIRSDPSSGATVLTTAYARRPGRSQITLFVLPMTGQYKIAVHGGFDPAVARNYTLLVEKVEPTPIAYGEMVEGRFTEQEDSYFYAFDVDQRDTLDFNVTGEDNLDTVLTVYDALGNPYVSDDDGGAGLNPEANNVYFAEIGTYVILVEPFTPGVAGTFTLNVERSPNTVLEDGEPITLLLDKQSLRRLTFDALAGETIRLNLSTSEGVSINVNVYQHETQLLNLNPFELSDLALDFTIPRSGAVTIELERSFYRGFAGEVEVSIDRLSDGDEE